MDKIQSSLKRIEGQVRGIERLYNGKKPCLEVVQQVAAAREALSRVGRELLKQEACRYGKNEKKLERILEKLFKS